MSQIIRNAQEEIRRMEILEKKIDDFLETAPSGCLKWQHKRDKIYYYQQYKDENISVSQDADKIRNTKTALKEETTQNNIPDNILGNIPGNIPDNIVVSKPGKENGKEFVEKKSSPIIWRRRAIKKDNMNLARALARKNYYHSLKLVIKEKLEALRKFTQNYPEIDIDEIYDDMCDERKILLESIETTVKERVKRWNEEVYEKNPVYSDGLRYETDQGEMVRSKSEVIIANILYQHKKDILYKYERPLTLQINGYEKVIYPDFTIINLHTGKVIYWEHAGLMDDSHYANDFVWKVNTYTVNNLLLGKDVIFSFETSLKPLEIQVVKRIVMQCLINI